MDPQDNVILWPKTPYPRGDATCTIPLASYHAMVSLARHVRDMINTPGVKIAGDNANMFAQQLVALYDAFDHLRTVDQMTERQLRQ